MHRLIPQKLCFLLILGYFFFVNCHFPTIGRSKNTIALYVLISPTKPLKGVKSLLYDNMQYSHRPWTPLHIERIISENTATYLGLLVQERDKCNFLKWIVTQGKPSKRF
uniref:Uncharacterized protein n=1 Tax=Anguilla anguilla TaxID=7936 RepID=A0A0E9XG39_ANGAN